MCPSHPRQGERPRHPKPRFGMEPRRRNGWPQSGHKGPRYPAGAGRAAGRYRDPRTNRTTAAASPPTAQRQRARTCNAADALPGLPHNFILEFGDSCAAAALVGCGPPCAVPGRCGGLQFRNRFFCAGSCAGITKVVYSGGQVAAAAAGQGNTTPRIPAQPGAG